jgi:hypothetical protein
MVAWRQATKEKQAGEIEGGKMREQPQECKLEPAQRYEVNSLMEAAQDDLESVLFQLVWQREKAEAELAAEREKYADIEADGVVFCGKCGSKL